MTPRRPSRMTKGQGASGPHRPPSAACMMYPPSSTRPRPVRSAKRASSSCFEPVETRIGFGRFERKRDRVHGISEVMSQSDMDALAGTRGAGASLRGAARGPAFLHEVLPQIDCLIIEHVLTGPIFADRMID